ncbi:hypothetical protein BS50DRAFT_230617 [Corynespora cassiicola Philippines]|uniref:F-box domain-containing protein n=1 Tax=Corynespora cassiicola Philippines TaxID=1448308 RepID=A0A2T2N1R4_CORCC|nr:hypothetical protein BS50DRAFT_230617 [Corynespora cassiicola Philippines]
MGSSTQPIVTKDGDNTPLPPFLFRHATLGFDATDVTALITAISSSQNHDASPRNPHLPAEILLNILEYVPVPYILNWRLVCRGFHDAIGGRILYEFLKRAEVIGYLGSRSKYPLDIIKSEDYDDIYLLRARFSHLEDEHASTSRRTNAKWGATHAVFEINDKWFEYFAQIGGSVQREERSHGWAEIMFDLELGADEEEGQYGTLRWCMRVDKAVLDLGFTARDSVNGIFQVDLEARTVRMEWKQALFDFLKTETALQKLLHSKRKSAFTFGQMGDCFRAIRRQRLRAALDTEDKDDRRINWAMNQLPPLFGKRRYDKASAPWDGLERAENKAISILCQLRREAKTTPKELARLQKIAEERKIMEKELNGVAQTFGEWKYNMYKPEHQHQVPIERLPILPKNPAIWNTEVRKAEEERVKRWKSQRDTIQRLALLLSGSTEALAVPDNAFDDLDDF